MDTKARERHISLIIAEQIMALFEESEATATERYAALDVARAMIPAIAESNDRASNTELVERYLGRFDQ